MKTSLAVMSLVLILGGVLADASRLAAGQQSPALETATFAGGCFWCMEEAFEKVDGVVSAVSGYTGGRVKDPKYDQVSSGTTDHAEAVQVLFDPSKINYAHLLDVFWRNVDPTDVGGQFCDRGSQYRSAIFVHDGTQRRFAEDSKRALEASGFQDPIATEIVAAPAFYPAEDYHQDYYKKNPVRYRFYKYGCGRERRLAQVWQQSK